MYRKMSSVHGSSVLTVMPQTVYHDQFCRKPKTTHSCNKPIFAIKKYKHRAVKGKLKTTPKKQLGPS